MSFGTDILDVVEAEAIVDSLEAFLPNEIGSERWWKQYCKIEKLNMQAVLSASHNKDEFVKDLLISLNKLVILVHEIISTEVWKEAIFPKIIDLKPQIKLAFPLYLPLHYEAVLSNLFETTLYHQEASISAEDALVDLVDYCCRKLVKLVTRSDEFNEDTEAKQDSPNSLDDLVKSASNLEFSIGLRVLSLVRYMTDHYRQLQPSVITRLIETNDIIILLVQVIENPPWLRTIKNKLHSYNDGKWFELSAEDRFILNKTEAQVWISLFHLLLEPECQEKYKLNNYRKDRILKLRAFLTDNLVNQMSCLKEMQRYLDQLAIMGLPAYSKSLTLEQIPEIRNVIIRQVEGKEEEIAKHQMDYYVNLSPNAYKKQAAMLNEVFDLDKMDSLLPEPRCVVCGKVSTKRCCRCRVEWYCTRACQVSHWNKHKVTCDLVASST